MADTWETLQSECLHCHDCALAETRTHVVFGDGSRQAKILLIGEGPGQHEDEQGGSSASRKPSPKILNAITVIMIATPGMMLYTGR